MELGATWDDFVWDYRRGFISFPKHEPQLSGHVFNALDLAAQHGHTHVLQDLGLMYRRSPSSDPEPAHVFNIRGKHSFNEMLALFMSQNLLCNNWKMLFSAKSWRKRLFHMFFLLHPHLLSILVLLLNLLGISKFFQKFVLNMSVGERQWTMRSLRWYALVFIVEFLALQLALDKFLAAVGCINASLVMMDLFIGIVQGLLLKATVNVRMTLTIHIAFHLPLFIRSLFVCS
jgi:hypothetical protein